MANKQATNPFTSPSNGKIIFSEDLRDDPDYRGISGWWEKTFQRNFNADWTAAKDTEVDGGDNFTRTVKVNESGAYCKVVNAPDGFHVHEVRGPGVLPEGPLPTKYKQLRFEWVTRKDGVRRLSIVRFKHRNGEVKTTIIRLNDMEWNQLRRFIETEHQQ